MHMGTVRDFLIAQHAQSAHEGWRTVIWGYEAIDEYVFQSGSSRLVALCWSINRDYAILRVEFFRAVLAKGHCGMYADSRVCAATS